MSCKNADAASKQGRQQRHLADKPWQKVLLADLLWEKNITEWLADSANKLNNYYRRVPGSLELI